MRRPRTLAAALVCAVLAGTAAVSSAADEAAGLLCGFTSVRDPQIEGVETGEIDAGPVYLGSPAGVTCTIQVNASTHWGTDACSVTGPTTAVVGFVAGTCTFAAADQDNIYMCTQVDFVNGTRLYFSAGDPLMPGHWTTDPSASCSLAYDIYVTDGAEADPFVCPVLAGLLPPEGDVPSVWDCPPYDSYAQRDKERKGAKADRKQDPGPPSEPPDPTGSGSGTTPFRPTGTIEISSAGAGPLTFTYTGFDPPVAQWLCEEVGTSASCTPPAPPAGRHNVCGSVRAEATNHGPGSVGATSGCTGHAPADARSNGPTTTPTAASSQGSSQFPWSCVATPGQSAPAPWVVKCQVM